jgi:ATP-dependent DNA ligase
MRPAFVLPMKAVLTAERPAGPEWGFERKLDGIRCLAVKDGGRTRLYSRNELSLNDRYALLAAASDADPADSFVIDGEAVAFVVASAWNVPPRLISARISRVTRCSTGSNSTIRDRSVYSAL